MSDKCNNLHPDSRFSCNICLECVNNPIVTLCGHIFCWDCIYIWLKDGMVDEDYKYLSLPVPPLNFSNTSRRLCPVCKADCNVKSIIPIYVRDIHHSATDQEDRSLSNDADEVTSSSEDTIPVRPTPPVSSLYTGQASSNTSSSSIVNSHGNESLNTTSSNSTSNPSLFQALLRLQTTIHHLHPSVSPTTISSTNGNRMQSRPAAGSLSIRQPSLSSDPIFIAQSTNDNSSSQDELNSLIDRHATTTTTSIRLSTISDPSSYSSNLSPSTSDSVASSSVDPTTEFLSRLLLLLGSFVILCLLLF